MTRRHLQEYQKEQTNLKNKILQAQKAKSTLERDKSSVQHQLSLVKNRKSDSDRSLSTHKKEIEILKGQIAEKEESLSQVQAKMDERAGQLRKEREELERIHDDVYRDFCAELKISNISEFEGSTNKEHRERTERLLELTSQVAKQNEVIRKLRDQQRQAEDLEKLKQDELERINKEIEEHKVEKLAKEKEIR